MSRPFNEARRDKKYCSRPHSRKKKCNVWEKKESANPLSASFKKLSIEDYPSCDANGYRLVDVDLFMQGLQENLACKECGSEVTFQESEVKGLGSKFNIVCTSCSKEASFYSSKFVGSRNSAYEVNRRAIFAFRCIGKGHTALKKFCGLMDLPKPPALTTYNTIRDEMLQVSNSVAEEYQRSAIEEEVQSSVELNKCSDEPTNIEEVPYREIAAQFDRTWQKSRGFNSKNGVVVAIGAETGKVLDAEVLSSYCLPCKTWIATNGVAQGPTWDTWYAEHQTSCTRSHNGSASSMEVHGVLNIFNRSEEKFGVKYVQFIGDGDTKSFSSVVNAKPYGDSVQVEKIECVGHVQKRFGSRARKLKVFMRGKKLSDGKTLSGRGRLTDAVINQLQTYYGNAIRSNCTSVDAMYAAIWAIYFHKISSDEDPQHHLCPTGEESWCSYQKAVASGKQAEYRHKNSLPVAVMEALKPIFKDLSSQELLRRCIGGKTQNANESFNNLLWSFCPKEIFVTAPVVKVCANLAIITFCDGNKAILKVMKGLKIEPGKHCASYAFEADSIRVEQAEKKAQQSTKAARQIRRRLNIHLQEENELAEGVVYEAGGF